MRIAAIFLSILVPGFGQALTGRLKRSFWFLGSVYALGGGAYLAYYAGFSKLAMFLLFPLGFIWGWNIQDIVDHTGEAHDEDAGKEEEEDLYTRSRIALLRGDLETAREGFRVILALEPGDLDALFQLGRVEYMLGNRSEAVRRMEEVLRRDPIGKWASDAELLLGEIREGASVGS